MAPIPRPQILVVDDDPAIREALTAALEEAYVVHLAATGAAACRILERKPIKAIVLDAMLGDEHGLDLVPRFRACRSAPILILTGHSTEELAVRAVRAHIADYLRKPIDLRELRAALARLVGAEADPVARVRERLAEQPERPLRIASLAREYGLSDRHLRRRFRGAYGMTPRQYLTRVRLERAALLLRTTVQSIKAIAQAVGFSAGAELHRAFTRQYGVPPSGYRGQEPSGSARSRGRRPPPSRGWPKV